MAKTKIEWCDFTWNPVWGCLNDCPYCYARKIAKRFGRDIAYKELQYFSMNYMLGSSSLYEKLKKDLTNFKPTFLWSNLDKKFPKKSSRIFVNSMSEINYWKSEWMNKVLDKIKKYPKHKFLFLTKFPGVYNKYEFPENCWLGVTVTNQKTIDDWSLKGIYIQPKNNNIYFFSLEPLQEEISLFGNNSHWVIIGMETGNRKGKIIPQKKWIGSIVKRCRKYNIPVFMKDNLKQVWGKNLIQEFPG